MSEIIKKSDALNVINAIDLHEDANSFKALSHAYKDIALLPTIEAIPIEWIMLYIQEYPYMTASSMLHYWSLDQAIERKEE